MGKEIIMAKTSFIDILKIFGDLLDGSSDWLNIFGFSLAKKKGGKGKKDTFEIKNVSDVNGEIEEVLQTVNDNMGAKQIFEWIDLASKDQFEINEAGNKISIDDNVIMVLLSEIPEAARLKVYSQYNKGTKKEFQQALTRLLNEPTKRMRFVKSFIKKIKPALEKGGRLLNHLNSPQLVELTAKMNERSQYLRKKRADGNWFTKIFKKN